MFDSFKGFSEEICSRDVIGWAQTSLNLEEGCPHPVEIWTNSSLKWCNLVHFGDLIYVNTGMILHVLLYKNMYLSFDKL